MSSIVELKNVTKSFLEADGGAEREILAGIDLAIESGDRMAIVGSSGCGKSTLLNILGTLDKPTSGSVSFSGKDVLGLSEKEISQLRSESIGFIFQLHHLLPQSTVLENVILPSLALAKKPNPAEVKSRAEKLLERVGLTGQMHQKPHQISGGERQRAAVVRALINRPRIILADEPTGALDQERAGELVDLLVELNEEEKVALVMVTHDPGLAERMGRVIRIDRGKLV
jgi:lipoprotein-releasing system ATP-binding protein